MVPVRICVMCVNGLIALALSLVTSSLRVFFTGLLLSEVSFIAR